MLAELMHGDNHQAIVCLAVRGNDLHDNFSASCKYHLLGAFACNSVVRHTVSNAASRGGGGGKGSRLSVLAVAFILLTLYSTPNPRTQPHTEVNLYQVHLFHRSSVIHCSDSHAVPFFIGNLWS